MQSQVRYRNNQIATHSGEKVSVKVFDLPSSLFLPNNRNVYIQ